ncbi:phosphatidylinositol 3,4,5-trisphosphate 3-phosphatase and protein-tyrosine-phosphatase PTEN1-like protein [Tanacetum coccineum]
MKNGGGRVEMSYGAKPVTRAKVSGVVMELPDSEGSSRKKIIDRLPSVAELAANPSRLVSQKKRRMLVGGYDLDMSYITPRILAMSFPAEQMKAIYRNPMWQVKDVLEMRHKGHYKVCNLCIEEEYDPSHFNNLVERFPFDDNHVPSLEMIKELCESVHSWLSSDPKNTVVIHYMAGKGRTGLMVSSYLTYTRMSTEEALQVYADKRTTNILGGIWHVEAHVLSVKGFDVTWLEA